MAEIKRLKKGLDIPLQGALTGRIVTLKECKEYAIIPDDYPGFKWRLQVKEGEAVKIGTPLLSDKSNHGINIVSPVAGTILRIERGERRKIERIVISTSADSPDLTLDSTPDFSTEESTRDSLARTGLWVQLRQRPYDIIPQLNAPFRDIFVTAFDSSPHAPDIITPSEYPLLEEGLKVLSTLTKGKIYIGMKFGAGFVSKVAEVTEYDGPHPAGNVGTQIALTSPVNKGEIILTLDARTAVRIGRMASFSQFDMSAEVAVTGPEVKTPITAITRIGVKIDHIIKSDELTLSPNNVRIISGNVLSGRQVSYESGFLRFPWRQITVISEGDKADEFMGWASMNPKKFSVKRTFPAFLRGMKAPFKFDSRILGGHRAMILSGEYDKVFPLDIYPEYLIKAIIAGDIDRMEKLGIYEVAPEDFALAEFVDTSKLPLQQIVADGLENLRRELEE